LELGSGDGSEADKEEGTTSTGDFRVDTADEDREDRAICNSRNFLPTTNRRLPGSKPIGNTDNAIAHPRPFAALV